MRTNHLRTISQWFWWEDLDFPNPAVEERIRKNVEAAAAAKVELAVVFGYHFRWDYIYNFDLVHKLIAFAVNEYHKHGIKVIDHHSAVLTYRPRNWNDRQENFNKNHHHVPMTPDPAIIGDLHYAGKRLNDLRQLRTDDNSPLWLPSYHCEIFCVNNPDFRHAYRAYVQRLFAETGIDGLMCDDVCYYGRWGACGCPHCRQKFRALTGKTLPPSTDFNFWGNYDNPDFRVWVAQHVKDGRDFLAMVRESIPKDAILTSCCSSSTYRYNDGSGLDLSVWESSLNAVMLEMCGNISGDKNSIEVRIPDMLLNCGIAERRDLPCLGLGYAFFPAEGFRTWSLTKFFNSDVWISSHKTRCGLTTEEQRALPDEPEIVHEAYNFDAAHPELSELDDLAEIAVYFSSPSRNFNGKSSMDYVDGFKGVIRGLYRANIGVNVICVLPEDASKVKYLVLTDVDCLNDAERAALDRYMANGGTVIACGLLGGKDELGNDHADGSYLKKFGIDPIRPTADNSLPKEFRPVFFNHNFYEIPGVAADKVEYNVLKAPGEANEFGFYALNKNLYWSNVRAHAEGQAENIVTMLASMITQPLNVKLPDSLRYRVYRAKDGGYVIHFMPINVTGNLHPTLRLHKVGQPVVESLNYEALTGSVEISGAISGGTLYAADFDKPVTASAQDGKVTFDLDGLKRFFSIKVN